MAAYYSSRGRRPLASSSSRSSTVTTQPRASRNGSAHWPGVRGPPRCH